LVILKTETPQPFRIKLRGPKQPKMGKLNLCPSEHHSIKKRYNLQELQPQLFSIQPTHSQQKIQEYPFSFPQNKPKDFTMPIRPSHRKSSKNKEKQQLSKLNNPEFYEIGITQNMEKPIRVLKNSLHKMTQIKIPILFSTKKSQNKTQKFSTSTTQKESKNFQN
jgi:hypothetical protein